jgi:drug/metabolite transporter (DMT)-like permease
MVPCVEGNWVVGMHLPWDATFAALLAALLHATWNAVLKGGNDRLADASLLFLFAGALGLVSTFLFPPIDPSAWIWVVATSLLHVPYVYFLARAYEHGDLSHVYTIARGLPPILVVSLGAVLLGEIPSMLGLAGVVLISLGILTVGMTPGAQARGTGLALLVAVTITLYTLSDGIGVRASGSPVAYNGWIFFGSALTCMTMALALRGRSLVAYAQVHWRRAMFGGVVSFVAYGLVLWAMTRASIGGVSALRETSVVFAALFGMFLLGERAAARRLLGAVIVAAGAVTLKLS